MVVNEARQQVAQLQEEALARDVGVGIHVEGRGEAIVEVEEQAYLVVVERRGRGNGDGLVPRGEHRPAVGAALRDPKRFARAKAQQHGLVVETASRPLRKPEARLGHGLGRGGRSRTRPIVRLRDHSRDRSIFRLSLRGRAFPVVEVAVLQSYEPHVGVVVGRLQPMGAVAVGPRRESAPSHYHRTESALHEEKPFRLVAQPRMLEMACVAQGVEWSLTCGDGVRLRLALVHYDAGVVCQPSAGVGKILVHTVHHEVYRSAVCVAGKAAVCVGARVECQTGVVVVVEGTEALVADHADSEALCHCLYGQLAELQYG